MSLHGLKLHHHGVRIDPQRAVATLDFYRDVLGLEADPARRDNPSFPGAWLDCANDTQIHLMGVTGVSPFAISPERDPATPHVALAVADIAEAQAELLRLGADFFAISSGETAQLFVNDPSGNMIELHQDGMCRCERSRRPSM